MPHLDHPSSAGFLLRKALFVLRRPKMNRNAVSVSEEYSAGWASYLKYLDQASDLRDWLLIPGVDDEAGFYNGQGKLSWGEFACAEYYRSVLQGLLAKHFPSAQSVTEFGAGVGRNLLYLKEQRPELRAAGYELCAPGVDVARAAAQKFGLDVRYEQLDYLRDPPEKYVLPKADVVFTLFSLEQLPDGVDRAIENILAQATLGAIHIEPVPENYPFGLRGLLGRLDHWKVDYLAGFDRAVRRLRGLQVSVERLESAHNPLMFPSAYVLRKA